MNFQKLLQCSFNIGFILLFVTGCSARAATPTQPIIPPTLIPPTAILFPTPIPLTATSIPTPIQLTATLIPPTVTSTPLPEPNETYVVMTFNIECGAGVAPVPYSPNCMRLYERAQAEGGRIDRVI